MPGPVYRGVYINLDRSSDRRDKMEAQIAALGLSDCYARLSAVDGSTMNAPHAKVKPGELGCFLSHRLALEQVRGAGMAVHVLEDDTILSAEMRGVIEDAVSDRLFEHFDILYLDTFVQPQPVMLKWMKSAFDRIALRRPLRLADMQILDLARQSFAGATSYVVGPRAIERVLELLARELASGPRIAFDLFLRDQAHAGALRPACVFPFLTSIRLETVNDSTLRGDDRRIDDPSVAVMAALRYSFFLNRDIENIASPYLDAAAGAQERKHDPHRDLLERVIGFVMSDEFKAY